MMMTETAIAWLEALGRLMTIAQRDTGQSRRLANFLLAWHNAEENGGWDPTDLWGLDTANRCGHFIRAASVVRGGRVPG